MARMTDWAVAMNTAFQSMKSAGATLTRRDFDCQETRRHLIRAEFALKASEPIGSTFSQAQVSAWKGLKLRIRLIRLSYNEMCWGKGRGGRSYTLGALDADWTPRVIHGERGDEIRIPSDSQERSFWREGFLRAVRGTGIELDLGMPQPYRDGYAVGRRVRRDPVAVAEVLERIGRIASRDNALVVRTRKRPRTPEAYTHGNAPLGSGRGKYRIRAGPRLTPGQFAHHFATEKTPAHTTYGLSTDGTIAYSYQQAIAVKRGKTAWVESRKFSATTARHIAKIVIALTTAGYRVERRELPPGLS